MKCASCGLSKAEVQPTRSAIMPMVQLLICNSCKEQKFEPRHLIILVARSKGADTVRDYIVKRRYAGAEITAHDITP